MAELIRNAVQKPAKGTVWLEGRERRADRKAHEQKEMQAALKRDGRKCRRPRCRFTHLKPLIDPAHMVHRGMGGDPRGTRTTRATVISLCRPHHGRYDSGDVLITPLTADDFDGPCEWHERDEETGEWAHLGTETRIGVSVPRT